MRHRGRTDVVRRTLVRACVCAVGVGCLIVPAQAAAAKPSIRWVVQEFVTVGKPSLVRYALVKLPNRDTAYLQRLEGRRWVNVARLKSRYGGSVSSGPLRTAGVYTFRVVFHNRRGRVIGYAGTQKVHVVAAGSSPTTQPASNAAVSWTLPATASAGVAIPFNYTATVPSGASLVVQQQEGTKHVWQTIGTLSAASGASSISAQGIGQAYGFRIAVLQGRTVLTERDQSVNVFGQVSLQTLLANEGYSGTYTTTMNTFNFVDEVDAEVFDLHGPIVTQYAVSAADNDCRSVQIDFVLGDTESSNWVTEAGDVTTVSVIQQSSNPVAASSGLNVPGSVTASVVPGQSWSVSLSEADPKGDIANAYLDGYAICDSTKATLQVNN